MDTAIVEFVDQVRGRSVDVQIPLFLSADELVKALTIAYDLPLNLQDPTQVYLRSENPIALLAGKQSLEELGVTNGTRVIFEPRKT